MKSIQLLWLNHERHDEEEATGLVDEREKPLKRTEKNGKKCNVSGMSESEARQPQEIAAPRLFTDD